MDEFTVDYLCRQKLKAKYSNPLVPGQMKHMYPTKSSGCTFDGWSRQLHYSASCIQERQFIGWGFLTMGLYWPIAE